MTHLETATVAEIAADYRKAIDSGELTWADMATIAYNAAVARRDGLCGECWPPGARRQASKLAAAMREATRGES